MLIYALKVSRETGYVFPFKGNLLINPSEKIAAVFYAWIYLSPGIVTWKSSTTSPVLGSSILFNNYLKILNDDGTTPDASPECTPSFNT